MQVDHLHKATTEVDKEHYKKEGWCFNCGMQGHLSHACSRKGTSQMNPPVIAQKTTDETPATTEEEPQYMAQGVLKFMKGMDNEQYQSLAEAWAQMA